MAKITEIVSKHLPALTRRRMQLVRKDAYGKLQKDRWYKEIDYFLDNHVITRLTPEEQQTFQHLRAQTVRLIIERAEAGIELGPVFKTFSESMTPADFESFCAEQLTWSGWNAEVTMHSRDQGVDVIAEKNGIRVVLQCKLYSGPVGNGAVQEIVAGRAHECAHYGAVVTNSRYTAPAEQLASTNGILLLHYRDLPTLDTMLAEDAA